MGKHGCRSYKGVRKRKSGKWVAEIHHPTQKRQFWIGSFETEEMAVKAYDYVAYFLRGSKARLNFPENVPKLPSFPFNPTVQELRMLARQSAEGDKPPGVSELHDGDVVAEEILCVDDLGTEENEILSLHCSETMVEDEIFSLDDLETVEEEILCLDDLKEDNLERVMKEILPPESYSSTEEMVEMAPNTSRLSSDVVPNTMRQSSTEIQAMTEWPMYSPPLNIMEDYYYFVGF